MPGPTAVLLVVDQLDSYHQQLLHGIHDSTDPAGLVVLAHAVDPRGDRVPATLGRLLASGRICGVIGTHLASPAVHDRVSELLHESGRHLPVVYIGAHPKASAWTVSDNSVGMRELLAHLLDEVGVRKPVLMRGIPHQPDSREREALVREELQRRGLTLEPEFVVDGGFARMASYRELSTLLRTRRDMDAVIAFNDRSAIGAADALKQAGLRVPDDVVLTGFDNEPVAVQLDPPLTSVDQDLRSQGRAAAKMLIDHANGDRTSHEVRVATRLVVRASSRPDLVAAAPEPATPGGHSTASDVTLAMSRAFMACSTLESLTDELVINLPRLGVNRCLMVLEDDDPEADPERGRLVLDFDVASAGDHRRDVNFLLADVLPTDLMDHLDMGTMVLQPLSVGDEYFGYAIIDSARGTISGETLQLDLSRALSTIESKRRLAEYAEQLERRVTLRTQQLEAEVAARRRTELDLVRLNAELRKSLFIDGLTRIANRTALDENLVAQWREHESSGHTLSMIFVDVDHFKAYNDHYGHLRGDDVLRIVASCLSEAVRGRDDLAARYGGEEFAVILPQTDEPGAAVVAERIRALVRAAEVPHAGSPAAQQLTVSLGVASVRPAVDQVRVDHLIALADQALYRAKATGRDRVCVASECEPLGDDRTVPTNWHT